MFSHYRISRYLLSVIFFLVFSTPLDWLKQANEAHNFWLYKHNLGENCKRIGHVYVFVFID